MTLHFLGSNISNGNYKTADCFCLTGRDLNGGQQAYSKKSKQQQKKVCFF